MSGTVSKCGIDCGACPWGPYSREGMTTEEFESFKNKAKSILGYMPIQKPCVTCQTPDGEIPKTSKLPNRSCLIRQCVDKAGVANCAYCARFPCDTLKATADAWNRQKIEAKLGVVLSDEDYKAFVEPFEGLKRLETIHATLKQEELVEPTKTLKAKATTVDFPEELPFSKEETASFKAVHKLLATLHDSSLGMSNTDTFAQQHKLETLRAHVFRFLWIFGCYGKLEQAQLVVDPEAYFANRGNEKTLAIWAFVQSTIFKILSEQGVCCERSALKGVKEEDLTTGTGYLRGRGWIMTMKFEQKLGGAPVLKAFQEYTQMLDNKYGKKAFKQFVNVDMQVLSEKRL